MWFFTPSLRAWPITKLIVTLYYKEKNDYTQIEQTCMIFNYFIHSHTSLHRKHLMVSSDIKMSYFKGCSSPHALLWYLKQLRWAFQLLSAHTYTHRLIYKFLHLSKSTLIGPSAEPLREKKTAGRRKMEGTISPPSESRFNATFTAAFFLSIEHLFMLVFLTQYSSFWKCRRAFNKLYRII